MKKGYPPRQEIYLARNRKKVTDVRLDKGASKEPDAAGVV
jgi:hypothetical protein